MRGLLAPRPRNDSPVPLAPRRAMGFGSMFGSRADVIGQLDTMATNGTVFGIVDRIAQAIAGTEWKLYRKAASGNEEDRVRVTRHAALDIVTKPNPFYSRATFFEASSQHADLTGETWWVVGRSPRLRNLPLELWPVRPDRMTPVPHPTKFLAGYIYTSPDGEQVPLELDEVIFTRRPNPSDPYRGLGPVQAILTDVHSARYAAEWNKNFFLNSAEPGGIIEVEKRLSDPEFDELTKRWNEQHRGVARAHRVAVLEQGKWIDRKYTQRDMEFTALRGVTRDALMEAFGFPKAMLGITQDVNRANAEAGEVMFARWLIKPRLERWRDALNGMLLPLFGDTARDLEFDFDNPVPDDEAAENAAMTAKAAAAKTYIDAGFDGESVKEALELPDALVWEKPAPPKLPAPGAQDQPAPVVDNWPAQVAALAGDHPDPRRIRSQDFPTPPGDWPERDEDAVDAVDLSPVQAAWEAALAALLELWRGSVVAAWIDELLDQIRAVLRGEGTFTSLTVDTDTAASHLADAMRELAETAAGHAVDEAAEHDVTLTPAWPTESELQDAAQTIATFEGQRYAQSAGREAARIAWPDADPDEITDHVRTHLEGLSDSTSAQALGGGLTHAQNQARQATFKSGPVGALYASEQMDRNTCDPCREIHGRWVANTDDLAPLLKLYPFGGYIDCKGTWRCRGTVVGVWRPKTTEGGS
ncbi:phage portal protein [Amycolatopsis sp. NPDC006125]|uniref:phage portal protein n=1 Tax=Amycolatopsis sp. NPDC006125 TaxID=3156730 RepID=UPI0033A3BB82